MSTDIEKAIERLFEMVDAMDKRLDRLECLADKGDDNHDCTKQSCTTCHKKHDPKPVPCEIKDDFKCPHCGKSEGTWFDRSCDAYGKGMATRCNACGNDIDDYPRNDEIKVDGVCPESQNPYDYSDEADPQSDGVCPKAKELEPWKPFPKFKFASLREKQSKCSHVLDTTKTKCVDCGFVFVDEKQAEPCFCDKCRHKLT